MRERDEKGEAPPQLPAAWFFLGSVHIQATCGGHISHCDPRLQDCFQPKAPSFPCGHTSCAGFAITAFFLTLEILYNFCKKYFKAKKKKNRLYSHCHPVVNILCSFIYPFRIYPHLLRTYYVLGIVKSGGDGNRKNKHSFTERGSGMTSPHPTIRHGVPPVRAQSPGRV